MEQIRSSVRDIPDFPQPGIVFKDITPVLAEPQLLRRSITLMAELARPLHPELVLGIDARGFIFGSALACELGLGFIPARKPGKLPAQTISESYSLEYGEAVLELHDDALLPGRRVLVVDDVLATGGTAGAACRLVERLGGEVAACLFFGEIACLEGRSRLAPRPVLSLMQF